MNHETHHVCNKHNTGEKSVCCECTGKTDCSDITAVEGIEESITNTKE